MFLLHWQVSLGAVAVEVSAGHEHSCARLVDGPETGAQRSRCRMSGERSAIQFSPSIRHSMKVGNWIRMDLVCWL